MNDCPFCGDSIIQLGEQCDLGNWGPITGCSDFDAFTGGTLTCIDPGNLYECHFDTSGCTGGTSGFCGDGTIDEGEQCDGLDWGPITGCHDFDAFTNGLLTCDDNCFFNTSGCSDTGPTCGDGIIHPGEQCDGANWGPVTNCTYFDNYVGGTLSCNAAGSPDECLFDLSQCTGGNTSGFCGDGVINNLEQCDGSNWGPITSCEDFDSFTSGTLSCQNCLFNTSQCMYFGPYCGDNIWQPLAGESCDTDKIGSCASDEACNETCDCVPCVADGTCYSLCPDDPDCTTTIEGTVRETVSQDGISGAIISVVSPPPGFLAVTNDVGWYRIMDVPSGLRYISAAKPGYRSVTLEVDLPPGVTHTLNFNLSDGDCGECADWEYRCDTTCGGVGQCNANGDEVPPECNGARPDDWVLNSAGTGYVKCCEGWEMRDKIQGTITTAGCMEDLAKYTRLLQYQGGQIELIVYTWKPCP